MFQEAILPIFLLTLLLPQCFGIKCFLDTVGIPEPEPGEVVNTTTFRHFDCNLLGGEEKVRRNCNKIRLIFFTITFYRGFISSLTYHLELVEELFNLSLSLSLNLCKLNKICI